MVPVAAGLVVVGRIEVAWGVVLMGVSTVRWWPIVVLVSLTLSNHLVELRIKKSIHI